MRTIAGAKRATAVLAIVCMMLPQTLLAQDAIDESPNEFAMVGDLLVARPLGAAMVVGGTAVWLVSLPFTLLSGHASEAAGTLIGGPVESTFMRCLGCTNTGYTGRDIERANRDKEEETAE
jgi:hypothetical protein